MPVSGVELTTVLTAVFGAFGTILVGFYKYAQSREKDFEKSREIMARAYEQSNEHLAKSIDKMAQTNQEIANATIKQAEESKERNGHAIELAIENRRAVSNEHKEMIKIFQEIRAVQHIKIQEVDKQHVSVLDVEGRQS